MLVRLRWRLLLVGLFGLLFVFLAGCGDDDAAPDEPTTTEGGQPSTTQAPPVDTSVATGDEVVANVYWAWSIPSAPGDSPERIGAGGRPVSTASPAHDAMEALLAGPDAIETEIGMTTEIPADTELLDIAIDDGTATVDLSGAFEESGGTLGETMRAAQVVFTLTQFDSVDGVLFRIDGTDVEALGSHGLDATAPLTRDDFESVRPAILVESPTPGAEVGDEIQITGESNTFEANVVYSLTDGDGLIVAEGSTTATAGNGTWGEFDVTVAYDPETTGTGAVIVFEESAEDGSQINLVEYPLQAGDS